MIVYITRPWLLGELCPEGMSVHRRQSVNEISAVGVGREREREREREMTFRSDDEPLHCSMLLMQ